MCIRDSRIPAIVIGKSERAIFYGMPSGYEFSTLVNSIINSSLDSQNLDKTLLKNLKSVQTNNDVHFELHCCVL